MIEIKTNCNISKGSKQKKVLKKYWVVRKFSPVRFSFLLYEKTMFGLDSIFSLFFSHAIGGQAVQNIAKSLQWQIGYNLQLLQNGRNSNIS